jgi:hypothetical protein
MNRRALLAMAAVLALPAAARAQDLAVVGLDGQSRTLTAAQLGGLPRETVPMVEGGKTRVYEGPRLGDVLRTAGVPMGQRAHGDPLRSYLLVVGADGFVGVYSLAEVDKDLHDGAVILADQVDGAPLDAKHKPWRVLSSGDRKSWRAVYQVVRIEVRAAKP